MKIEIISGEDQGLRSSMEDRIFISEEDDLTLVGVFDGHGGKEVSQLIQDKLAPELILKLRKEFSQINREVTKKIRKKVREIVYSLFKDFDASLFENGPIPSGSTVQFFIFFKNHIVNINLGDSRGVVFNEQGKIFFESTDHKPTLNKEIKRITKAKHFLHKERVDGALALTRALGDLDFKLAVKGGSEAKYSIDGLDFITQEEVAFNGESSKCPLNKVKILNRNAAVSNWPDVFALSVDELSKHNSEINVLCMSDGLLECLSTKNIIKHLIDHKNWDTFRNSLAQSLIQYSLDKGAHDNQAVVLIKINSPP